VFALPLGPMHYETEPKALLPTMLLNKLFDWDDPKPLESVAITPLPEAFVPMLGKASVVLEEVAEPLLSTSVG
jgi:hypothetical protein